MDSISSRGVVSSWIIGGHRQVRTGSRPGMSVQKKSLANPVTFSTTDSNDG